MVSLVPLRTDLMCEESFSGYLVRLAELNGYRLTSRFLESGLKDNRRRVLSLDSGSWNSDTICKISASTGLSEEIIRSRVYQRVGSSHRLFFGHRVPETILESFSSYSRRKFCPKCISEDGFHLGLFDLTIMQVCTRHNIRLLDSCPHCRSMVSWNQGSICYCTVCNGDLARGDGQTVDPSELIGLSLLAQRANFPRFSQHIAGLGLPTSLSHLSLGELIELAAYMGFQKRRKGEWDPLILTISNRYRAHLDINSAFEYIEKWPDGFKLFLEHRLYYNRSSANSMNAGLSIDSNIILLQMLSNEREPWLTARAALDSYNSYEQVDHGKPYGNPMPRTAPHESRRFVTFKEAKKTLPLSRVELNFLVNSCSAESKQWKSGQFGQIVFDIAHLVALGFKFSLLLDFETAAERLGTSLMHFKMLALSNVFSVLVDKDTFDSVTDLVSASELENLIYDFEIRMKIRVVPAQTFEHVIDNCSYYGLPLNLLFRAIRCGELQPCVKRDNSRGLGAFSFAECDLTTWYYKTFIEFDDPSGLVPIWVAAKMVGVSTDTVLELLKDGTLAGEGGNNSGDFTGVWRRSIMQFKKDCILLGE